MLQAHSLLWHYLWVAPNVFLLVLGLLDMEAWSGGSSQPSSPSPFLVPVGQLAVYAADVRPSVTPENFWRVDWASLLIEGFLKFVVIGEIFAQVFGPILRWPSW